MNELSNFVDGAVGKGECENAFEKRKKKYLKAKKISKEIINSTLSMEDKEILYDRIASIMEANIDPPTPTYIKCGYSDPTYYDVYRPGNKALDDKGVCLNVKYSNGFSEYNVHSFAGFYESIATHK